jgi:hypothetical protein
MRTPAMAMSDAEIPKLDCGKARRWDFIVQANDFALRKSGNVAYSTRPEE